MELRLLGPMAVIDDGKALPLPASRKTRALLGYLAAEGKPVRRDRLCHLFWEIPDDPKGALRWSLSKLRGVVGDAIVADRETVALDPSKLAIDFSDLTGAAADFTAAPTERMQSICAAATGSFMEELDLPNCDDFNAWRIAVAEDARVALGRLCAELVTRDLPPEQLLPHVRAWVERSPYDPEPAECLCNLLVAADREEEAEQQRALAIRRLADAGIPASAALRDSPAIPLSAEPETSAEAAEPAASLRQEIQFCTASDGTSLAYSVTGEGPPLVKSANWLNHLEHDLHSPIWSHWIRALTAIRSVWRYDERGNGLSDWHAPLNFEAFVDDLESVVDAAGLDRFDLLGISQGAAVAIAYAVRHPERVRKMHLWGGYALGWAHRGDPAEIERREAMLDLTRHGWALDNPAYRQLFTSLYLPEGSQEQEDYFNEMQRVTTSAENAVALQRVFADIDVTGLLGKVTTPTLVGHSTRDAVVPFSTGRALAARIPGARFIAIESPNHLLLESDPGWRKYARIVEEFLES
ncbi:alpha/beta fold hydrolase [Sphingomonas sp. NSE70-1]|uniref:Alpha/beta fold hydrolase n=1 Tax=Sphingomonas caseinilyticus TaxID=2908205 RepID=A0ABT0RXR4_9SPHN|nr:alpha/beta fold hydrolase [Sphingomonas caseinilyticus]MCL6699623.1 alpha/beta fold hydrolase [Sphingomonas caseinilyticus]